MPFAISAVVAIDRFIGAEANEGG